MKFYPLKFKPIYKERIWGGQKLREVFGKDIPAGAKIGESWELADLPTDKSVIANGEFASKTLSDVLAKYPKEITGDENFSGAFPLLIKILDAEDILSVQVHPDAEACGRIAEGDAKTECWYIISSEPGAVIYKGLKEGTDREQFAEAIKQGTVAELLNEVAVKAGECHFLPAGTTHAIGGGLLIAEIQMPSDTTYRVFDWNRVNEDGKRRELHIAEALESIHFDSSGDNLSVTTAGRLVNSEYFKIDKGDQLKGGEQLFSTSQMRVLVFLTGVGRIISKAGEIVEFKGGDCVLVPAVCKTAVQFNEDTQYLAVTL
jgi:mannose-6-phosphate isomerase